MKMRYVAAAAVLSIAGPLAAADPAPSLADVAARAEAKLHESFANLHFEGFQLSPVRGPIYQASAGDKILYYAPESDHLLFATIYNKDGVNLTALAQEAGIARKLSGLDLSTALVIGPKDAPEVVEFTDPDCPYCRALEHFWETKAAEGKPVRRRIVFVTSIHPHSAEKAEHILCAPDPAEAFATIYKGEIPETLRHCQKGHDALAAHDKAVAKLGVSGTPSLIVAGKLMAGFQQGELEAFLDAAATKPAHLR